MKNQAFTLIELLVVVLIIGILAAIALPQYNKAVAKARFAEALVNLKTIVQADRVCRLNGKNSCSITELDVDIPGTAGEKNNFPVIIATNFTYWASVNPNGNGTPALALHNTEDVCICIQGNDFYITMNDECQDTPAKFDYATLLNITPGECGCC